MIIYFSILDKRLGPLSVLFQQFFFVNLEKNIWRAEITITYRLSRPQNYELNSLIYIVKPVRQVFRQQNFKFYILPRAALFSPDRKIVRL